MIADGSIETMWTTILNYGTGSIKYRTKSIVTPPTSTKNELNRVDKPSFTVHDFKLCPNALQEVCTFLISMLVLVVACSEKG